MSTAYHLPIRFQSRLNKWPRIVGRWAMKNLPWILMGTILVVITCSVTGFLLNGIHHTSAAINPQADLVAPPTVTLTISAGDCGKVSSQTGAINISLSEFAASTITQQTSTIWVTATRTQYISNVVTSTPLISYSSSANGPYYYVGDNTSTIFLDGITPSATGSIVTETSVVVVSPISTVPTPGDDLTTTHRSTRTVMSISSLIVTPSDLDASRGPQTSLTAAYVGPDKSDKTSIERSATSAQSGAMTSAPTSASEGPVASNEASAASNKADTKVSMGSNDRLTTTVHLTITSTLQSTIVTSLATGHSYSGFGSYGWNSTTLRTVFGSGGTGANMGSVLSTGRSSNAASYISSSNGSLSNQYSKSPPTVTIKSSSSRSSLDLTTSPEKSISKIAFSVTPNNFTHGPILTVTVTLQAQSTSSSRAVNHTDSSSLNRAGSASTHTVTLLSPSLVSMTTSGLNYSVRSVSLSSSVAISGSTLATGSRSPALSHSYGSPPTITGSSSNASNSPTHSVGAVSESVSVTADHTATALSSHTIKKEEPSDTNRLSTSTPIAMAQSSPLAHLSVSKPSTVPSLLTPTIKKSSSVMITSSSASATSTACGEVGKFTLDFDDLPLFSPIDNATAPFPPIFDPYHHLYFNDGFSFVPPPNVPFVPLTPPRLAVYEVAKNISVRVPDATTEPTAADHSWGFIGAGPRVANSIFWYDAFAADIGCQGPISAGCNISVFGYVYQAAVADEVLIQTEVFTLPACDGLASCHLLPITFATTFRGLSSLRIRAVVDGKPVSWFVDDLQLGWSNSSCAAGKMRAASR